MMSLDSPPNEEFCNGCCYNNNPRPELNCRKIKCCYLVEAECILKKETNFNLI